MKKNKKIAVSLLVFCFLVIGTTWVSKSGRVHSASQSVKSAPQTKPEVQPKSGVERINDKAKAVKGGADTDAIRGLTDEIVSQYGGDSAPPDVAASFKNRLVNAEEDFHNGNHKGISDTDVARAVNGFVTKFKTPEYSRTSPSEVKEIRGRLLTVLPDFVGRGRVVNGRASIKARGARIADMSPVEAAYTTMAVVYQKMYNPDFQLTKTERSASWIEKHSRTPRTVGKASSQPSATAIARQHEMEGVLQRVATTTSLQDLVSLPDKVLDVLGVERQKKEGK